MVDLGGGQILMSEVPLYAEAKKERDAVKMAQIGALNICVNTRLEDPECILTRRIVHFVPYCFFRRHHLLVKDTIRSGCRRKAATLHLKLSCVTP